MLLDRFLGEKTDSAPAPAKIERTANDVYKSFGVAFRRLIDELAEMRVEPTHVNQNLAAVAGIPPQFSPAIVQLVARRQMQATAQRAQPEVDLERLAGK